MCRELDIHAVAFGGFYDFVFFIVSALVHLCAFGDGIDVYPIFGIEIIGIIVGIVTAFHSQRITVILIPDAD
jgi:hypothetical protein